MTGLALILEKQGLVRLDAALKSGHPMYQNRTILGFSKIYMFDFQSTARVASALSVKQKLNYVQELF